MNRDALRQKLIDGTIHVIAQHGLDRTTTKQIGTVTDTNEAYIYRCFNGKEDLFAKAFQYLDERLVAKTMRHIAVMYMQEYDFETRARLYFSAIWEFMLANREQCLAYVRYFYSPYFKALSAVEHKKRFVPLVTKFQAAFKDEADVWMILNHILNVMLDFAVKVHNEEMPATEDYSEHVFRVIYASVKQYFKDDGIGSDSASATTE